MPSPDAPPSAPPPDGYDLWGGYSDLRAAVRSWIDDAVAPHVDEWERVGAFPRSLFRYAGAEGLLGYKVAPGLGGLGPDPRADLVVSEELAACGSGGVAAGLGAHKDLGSWYVARFGTPEQQQRWVPSCVRGELISALAVTEPDAGSDVAGISSRAVRQPDGDWVLSGAKTFITNGAWADVVVVAAVTEEDRDPHHAMSLFVVEASDPGFTKARISTLGWRTSSTGALTFADVRLPDDRLLGGDEGRGEGFTYVMRNFQWERIGMALAAVRSAADVAAETDVGQALRDEIVAARALTEHALRLILDPASPDPVRQTSMAKWYASEIAQRTSEAALAHLGADAVRSSRLERRMRDSRLGPIGGGTTQIMKEVVARTYSL